MFTEEEVRVFAEQFQKYYKNNSVYPCLFHSDSCSGKSIRSHTVQNSKILDDLVENGHVAMLYPEIGGVKFNCSISRNVATTFSGLCNKHDTELFKPIDLGPDEELEFNDYNNSLLAFRGICKEYFDKKNIIECITKLSDAIKSRNTTTMNSIIPMTKKYKNNIPWSNFNTDVFDDLIIGNARALLDFEPFFDELKNACVSKDLSSIQHDVITLPSKVEWALSSVITPNLYFDNTETPNIISHKEHESIIANTIIAKQLGASPLKVAKNSKMFDWRLVALNVVPCEKETKVIFSYLKKDVDVFSKYSSFLENLTNDKKGEYLSKFIISNVGNIVFKPDFVSKLGPSKSAIEKAFHETLPGDEPYTNFEFNLFA